MTNVILTIQLILAIALVGVVLIQRNEGGLGGLGGGAGGNVMTARGQANALTKATWIIFALFAATCMVLAIMTSGQQAPRPILDDVAAPTAPAPADLPSVPLSR